MSRRILLAWSGGKDAAWTLHRLRGRDDVEVVGLLTTLNGDFQRVAMHGIRRAVLRAQADAVGLPLLESVIPHGSDNDTYEATFAASLRQASDRWPGMDTVAFGDLLLADVRDWREAMCARHVWRILTPLFGSDTTALAREMLDGGLRTHLCCVDTQQLDARFAGRLFDTALLADLPAGADPCGENGEFHTLVEDGPMFRRPLQLQRGDTVLRDGRFAFTEFRLADQTTASS
ncbi:ATP-binding protein [Lysobacter sp. H23M47]|uniref:Dph6-related ATP pyrophosphatase n=1 Tax=Lysobacter sp. H23M47 TaxID=2781024 RepID=UPI0018820AE2|nr:ATP-binding protein [Lysobacter sp. H23M47]QOW24934.1 ATP-binding protein [Lysobacter sp. H23M47]